MSNNEARHAEPVLAANQQSALAAYLGRFVTPERQALIERVLARRTRYVTVVLENVSKAHNASAVLRSCDSFGVQDVHVIDSGGLFEVKSTATSGSHRWITRHVYRGAAETATGRCVAALRAGGYRIAATTVRDGAQPIDTLDLSTPVALCFGTELFGLSEALHAAADVWVTVPQVGFAESLNISVAAAICLYSATRRLPAMGTAWEMTTAERDALRVQWFKQSIRHADRVERQFWRDREE